MNISILPILFAILWPVKSHDLIAQNLGTNNFGGYHTGIDILVPLNTPVFAICDGTVVLNHTDYNYDSGFENYWNSFLIVEHKCNNEKIYGYYGHISSNFQKLDRVKSGSLIGYVIMAKSIKDKVTPEGIDRPSNTHLHFGLNKSFLTNQWGYVPSLAAVYKLGWINPITYLNISD